MDKQGNAGGIAYEGMIEVRKDIHINAVLKGNTVDIATTLSCKQAALIAAAATWGTIYFKQFHYKMFENRGQFVNDF